MRSILFHKPMTYDLISRFPFHLNQRWNHSQIEDVKETKENWIKRIENLEKKSKEQEKLIEMSGSMCIGLLIGNLYLISQINRLENTKQNKSR